MNKLFCRLCILGALPFSSSIVQPIYAQINSKTPEIKADFIFDQRDDLSGLVWTLYASNAQGKSTKLGDLPPRARLYDISPDNKWALCGTDSLSNTSADLYKVHLDGGGVQRLTFTGRGNGRAVFSPDGKKIVFNANGSQPINGQEWTDGADVWIMNADGTNQRNLTPRVGAQWDPIFSPDGEKIYFGERPAIYSMDLNGQKLQRVVYVEGDLGPYIRHFAIAADGKSLKFSSTAHYGAPLKFFRTPLPVYDGSVKQIDNVSPDDKIMASNKPLFSGVRLKAPLTLSNDKSQ